MKRKYLKSGQQVAKMSRLIAKGIDLFIVMILAVFLYPVGLVLAAVYLGVSDSLQGGQSIGKKFIGFSVISLEDGGQCTVKQSVIRNLPFLLPLVLAIFPFWGWVMSFILLVPLVCLELYLLFKLDSGHRLGDVMADTSVMGQDGGATTQISRHRESWFEDSQTEQTHKTSI